MRQSGCKDVPTRWLSLEQTSDIPQQTVTYQVTSQANRQRVCVCGPSCSRARGLCAEANFNCIVAWCTVRGVGSVVCVVRLCVSASGRLWGGGVGHLELDMG